MPEIEVTLPRDLTAQLGLLHRGLPSMAQASPGRYLAALIRQDLAARRAVRADQAQAVLLKYWPVVRAVAAKAFARIRGAIPLDELISAGAEEAAKAAHKFDPRRGFSPAPYIRGWAGWGIQALIRQRLAEQQDVRPDQDEDGSRWERLGGEDVDLESAPERQAVRGVLQRWMRAQAPVRRRIARALAQGLDDDQVSLAAGCDLAQVDQVRAELRALLQAQDLDVDPDELITPVQAALLCEVEAKAVYKALNSGKLPGRKRGGGWLLRVADVRAWARRRGA